MKVILFVLVSIAVTSACIGTGSDCDGIPDCKCDGSEVEAPCCFKMEPCPGAYMWIFYTRMMHFELNLMEHSNLWISRAMDLIEGGRSLIFAVGFKSSPRKTCDGRPD